MRRFFSSVHRPSNIGSPARLKTTSTPCSASAGAGPLSGFQACASMFPRRGRASLRVPLGFVRVATEDDRVLELREQMLSDEAGGAGDECSHTEILLSYLSRVRNYRKLSIRGASVIMLSRAIG